MAQPERTRDGSRAAGRFASDADASTNAAESLADLRERIDAVDRAILGQLNERARLVLEVGQLKHGNNTAVYEPTRERHIVDGLSRANDGPFPDAGLGPVFREIISATRSLEDPVQVAYLGPEGTFSHQAALRQFGALGRFAPVGTIRDVFAAGNVITGQGNIKASLEHGRFVAENLAANYLGISEDGTRDISEALAKADQRGEAAADAVTRRLEHKPRLPLEQVQAILARVKARQAEVGYEGDYKAWIESVTPPDME